MSLRCRMVETKRKDGKLSSLKRVLNGFYTTAWKGKTKKKYSDILVRRCGTSRWKKKIKQNPYNSNFKFRFEHFSLSWYKVHFFKKMNIVLNRHNHPVLLLITRRNTWQTPLKKRKLNKKTSYTSTNAERNDRSINH